MKCQWLRGDQRRLYRLTPFRVLGRAADDVLSGGARKLRKGGDSQWSLAACFDDAARVRRCYGSPTLAARQAVELARETGDPVVVGRQVGVDHAGIPVFESAGYVRTAKADPLSEEAFESWALSLSRGILSGSRADLAAMGTDALAHLDIPLRGLPPAQLERALLGYRTTIASPTANMVRVQRLEMSKTLRRVIRSVGASIQRLPQVRGALGTGFSINDREAARLLSRHHGFFVRDRHGQISQSMSAQARKIISDGFSRGLAQQDIARELRRMTGSGLRQEHYYRTVATNAVSRARSYSTGATYRAAGINLYRIEAVLDDRTTHTCEFLHGKVLPTGPSVAAIERTMNDPNPEAVVANQPFIVDRGSHLAIPTPGGGEAKVADIDRRSSGASPSGVSARFSNGMSSSDLVSAAVGFPPYHHNCRTTTVPV